MTRIADVIARDLSRPIEEIIKLDQADEETVYTELTEYVATRSLREGYERLFKAIGEYGRDPHEGVGAWISGFFGSGKSSFAKNLGYVLGDRTVRARPAAELLKEQLGPGLASDLLDAVRAKVPFETVMFDVQTDRASSGSGNASLSWFMYRALLRQLDYAEDVDIADLEQTLEADDKLGQFIEVFEAHQREELLKDAKRNAERLKSDQWRWRRRRKLAGKMNEASLALHLMDGKTYPRADSWATAHTPVQVTPQLLVERSFELTARRRPGKALVYVIDEVGAFVARSREKIEDLRYVTEQLGKASKNRAKAHQPGGPVWVVVTSQEKLDEVVAAIDGYRVDLAKLQDRFAFQIDLKAEDIREVATKRVLRKKPTAEPELEALFTPRDGALNQALAFERSHLKTAVGKRDFVDYYPYPPHFLELCIRIMAGIRLQPGAPRHLGGSNRTIIKQTFEMLRSRLRDEPVGRLVTLDLVYDLVQASLASEIQKDLADVAAAFGEGSWEQRAAKAVCLLGHVADVPRTVVNLAAVLCSTVDAAKPLREVEQALHNLEEAHFVRQTPDGYKLQTGAEKGWDTQRRSHEPKPRDRAEAIRDALGEIFNDPSVRSFLYRKLRTFKLRVTQGAARLADGALPLVLHDAERPEDLAKVTEAAVVSSRMKPHDDEAHWVYALTPEIDDVATELCRSRHMIVRYGQLGSQVSEAERACLADEKELMPRQERKLRDLLAAQLGAGVGAFRGNRYENQSAGGTLPEALRAFLDRVVPFLYEHLELGAVPLRGNEAEEILKAANLSGLSGVFYEGGLGLVRQEDGKHVICADAPVADQVLTYLRQRASYGQKVDGRDLEEHFTGLRYGWDVDVLRVVLAALLRAGQVELTSGDRRFRGHSDEACRVPFTNLTLFRGARFTPRETVSLKLLSAAAANLEGITGQEVSVEETEIAKVFARLADDEAAALLPVAAHAQALGLEQAKDLEALVAELRAVRSGPSDDCARYLAAQGGSLKESLARARTLRKALTPEHVLLVRKARAVARELAQQLDGSSMAAQARTLRELSDAGALLGALPQLPDLLDAVLVAYDERYVRAHAARREAFEAAAGRVRERAEWLELAGAGKAPLDLLEEFLRGAGHEPARAPEEPTCSVCRATVAQMEAEAQSAQSREAELVQRLVALVVPEEKVRRVRASELCDRTLRDPEAVEQYIEDLRKHLLGLVREGYRVVVE